MLIVLFPLVSLFVILCCAPAWFPTSLSPAYLEEFEHLAQQTPTISFPTSQIRTVEVLLAEVNSFTRESDAQPKSSIFASLLDAPANVRRCSDHLERIHTEIAGTFDRYVEFAMRWLIENLSSVSRFSATESAFSYYLGESGIRFLPLWAQRFLVGMPVELTIKSTLDLLLMGLSRSIVDVEVVRTELGYVQDHLNVLDHSMTVGYILASGLRGNILGRFWLSFGSGVSLCRVEGALNLLRPAIAQLEEVQLDLLTGIAVLSARRDELYVIRNKIAHGHSNSSVAHFDLASGLGGSLTENL